MAPLFALAATAFAGGLTNVTDFSTTAGTIVGIFLIIAAAAVVCALAFSIFKFIGHNIGDGIMWLMGSIIGGIIVGYATVWTATLTGINLG